MLPAFIGSLVVIENAQKAITIVFDVSDIISHKNDVSKDISQTSKVLENVSKSKIPQHTSTDRTKELE